VSCSSCETEFCVESADDLDAVCGVDVFIWLW